MCIQCVGAPFTSGGGVHPLIVRLRQHVVPLQPPQLFSIMVYPQTPSTGAFLSLLPFAVRHIRDHMSQQTTNWCWVQPAPRTLWRRPRVPAICKGGVWAVPRRVSAIFRKFPDALTFPTLKGWDFPFGSSPRLRTGQTQKDHGCSGFTQ